MTTTSTNEEDVTFMGLLITNLTNSSGIKRVRLEPCHRLPFESNSRSAVLLAKNLAGQNAERTRQLAAAAFKGPWSIDSRLQQVDIYGLWLLMSSKSALTVCPSASLVIQLIFGLRPNSVQFSPLISMRSLSRSGKSSYRQLLTRLFNITSMVIPH